MIEVADIDPVGDDAAAADLDVEVAVDGVVTAEDGLVADTEGAPRGS